MYFFCSNACDGLTRLTAKKNYTTRSRVTITITITTIQPRGLQRVLTKKKLQYHTAFLHSLTFPAPAAGRLVGKTGIPAPRLKLQPNSIAFDSAPRREVDSQPISPLARPAVSQTETHSLGFLSVADAAPSSGENFRLRASSGRMVMQLTPHLLVGEFGAAAAAAAANSWPARIRTADRKLCVGCVTIRPAVA